MNKLAGARWVSVAAEYISGKLRTTRLGLQMRLYFQPTTRATGHQQGLDEWDTFNCTNGCRVNRSSDTPQGAFAVSQ